ncbi:MAG: DUF2384 domain-containing protein [Pseudomonas sp.]|uniref:antitoxin Xre/MbcA/ParS toxin-binding domain-containing protein n=1 Tax=Pseudomonas sp. TaxID=306 RepID=UPI001216C292|nr:antitoxin Xre/MbcA/ParS toxin-binding domain-containing protein [Pseudomonas sp.]RZI72465.1 MAG: DUF2384 domain-containing protein [Pseudomonas sp.]
MAEALVARRSSPGGVFDSRAVYCASPADRVQFIKQGVSARKAKTFIMNFDLDQKVMLDALNLKTATVNKKAVKDEALSTDDSERVIGLVKLVGQLQSMIEESGDPDGFDAHEWLSTWLKEPLPAFGGVRPIDYLDTMEGQGLVSRALAQIQAGAYA